MFVTKRHHEAVVRQLDESYAASQMQYERRIEDLRERIEDLKRLVFAPNTSTNIPSEAREADAILTISEKPLDRPDSDMSPDDMRAFDAIMAGEHEFGLAE